MRRIADDAYSFTYLLLLGLHDDALLLLHVRLASRM